MLKKLLKDIFNQKGIYLLLFLGILEQVLFIILPYLSKYYVDFINEKNLNKTFYLLIFLGCFISIILIFVGVIKDYIRDGLIEKFRIEKSIYYFSNFFSLDYEYRNEEGTGKTITKINRGIDAQVTFMRSFYDFIAIFSVRVILIGGIFFTLYKPIIGIFLLIAITFTIINKLLSKKIKKLTNQEQEISEKVGRQTNKMIMESNLVKVFNKEYFEINHLKNIFSPLPKLVQKTSIFNNIVYTFLDITFHFLEILGYLFLGMLVIKSQMTLGEMTMAIYYVFWMWWPISILMTNISEYRNQISKYEALENFINQENKIKDGNKKFKIMSGEINLNNIDFGYSSERQIFHNFNLQIDGGKTTALVGHSGSGKSTIIKLILRNYITNSGIIEIDGQDIKDLEIKTLYENIGYLSQEPAVFDGSIKENLMYGVNDENIGDIILWEALKKVDLYDLIKETKDGLETEVGEKGLKLSGGERQRIALARIFLSNPKILILDEPTSALDSISENKVTKIITEMMKNKTVIVIAHRLQTVMNADNIIVLEKGKIIETGNHTELLLKDGIYASLVDLQRGVINE